MTFERFDIPTQEVFKNIVQLDINEKTPFFQDKNIAPGFNAYTDGQGRNTYLPLVSDKDQNKPGQYSGIVRIDENGQKSVSKDSQLKGSYHAIDIPPGKLPEAKATIIAVDYESASTIHDAITQMGMKDVNVLAAFSHPNLTDVARNIRRDNPDQQIVIASDNNIKVARHTGKNYAWGWGVKAAKEVNGMNIYPSFPFEGLKVTPQETRSWSSFNDVANGYENGMEMIMQRLKPIQKILEQDKTLAQDKANQKEHVQETGKQAQDKTRIQGEKRSQGLSL